MTEQFMTKELLAELHVSCAQSLGIILSLPNQSSKLKSDVRKRINWHSAEAHKLNPEKWGEYKV